MSQTEENIKVKCGLCDNYYTGDELTLAPDNKMLCQDCIAEHFNTCHDCGELENNQATYYMENLDIDVCSICFHNYSCCDNCDSYFPNDSTCPNCPKSIEDDLETIQEDSYCPQWVNFGADSVFPFHIGIEHELGTDSEIKCLSHFRKIDKGLFFGKFDGSVTGVEIVSMPATLEFWHNLQWEVPSYCRGEGAGGIHVHISRVYPESITRKVIEFFYENIPFIHYMGERTTSYAKIVSIDDYGIHSFTKTLYGDKYYAVNVEHDDTIEIRIFNSTTKVEKVKKAIEFTALLFIVANGITTSECLTIEALVKQARANDLFSNVLPYLESWIANCA